MSTSVGMFTEEIMTSGLSNEISMSRKMLTEKRTANSGSCQLYHAQKQPVRDSTKGANH